MAQFELKEWVNQSPEVVFDFITDTDNAPKISKSVTHMEKVTDGPLGVGTRLREDRLMNGQQAQADLVVAEYQPPHVYAVVNEQEGFTTTYRYTLTADNGGTAITLTASVRASGLKKLMEGVVASVLKKEDGAHLQHLKSALG